MKETPEARKQYDDIIDLPYAKSKQHHMSLSDRAAQFAPFAALSGYDDMVQEEARLTDSRIDLSEEELDNLNHQLIKIMMALSNGQHPIVSVCYFQPDGKKDGGRYVTVTSRVIDFNQVEQTLTLDKANHTITQKVSSIIVPFEQIQLITMND